MRTIGLSNEAVQYSTQAIALDPLHPDSSLYFLKKAADSGYLYRDTKAMPVFKPYHAHPVFRAVMRRFGLPEK